MAEKLVMIGVGLGIAAMTVIAVVCKAVLLVAVGGLRF